MLLKSLERWNSPLTPLFTAENSQLTEVVAKSSPPVASSTKLPPSRKKSAAKTPILPKKGTNSTSTRTPKSPKAKSSRAHYDDLDEASIAPIPINMVPLDTWMQIFSWFVEKECRLLRRVCKQWSDLIGARALSQRTHEDEDRVTLHMPWSCHALERPFPWKDSLYAAQVETLNMMCTDYGANTEAYFLETCPNLSKFRNLKNLAISSSMDVLNSLHQASLNHLETLTISAPHGLLPGVDKFTFNVQRLQLFGFTDLITQDVREMMAAFPNVKHLSFKGSSWESPSSAISWISSEIGQNLESLSLSFDKDTYRPERSITLADVAPLVGLPKLRALALSLNSPYEPETLPFGVIDDPFTEGGAIGSLSVTSSTINASSLASSSAQAASSSAPSNAHGIVTLASNTLESLCLKCLDGSKIPLRLEMPRLGSLTLDSLVYVDTTACSFLEQLKMWSTPPFISHFFERCPVMNLREVSLIRSPAKLATKHLALPLSLELPQATKLNLVDFSLRDLPSELSINGPLLKTLKMVFHCTEDPNVLIDVNEPTIPVNLQIPHVTQVSVEANPHILTAIYNQCCKIPSLVGMALVKCRHWRDEPPPPPTFEFSNKDPKSPQAELPTLFPHLSNLLLGTVSPPLSSLGFLSALSSLTVDADMPLLQLESILHNQNMPVLRTCNISIRGGIHSGHRNLAVSLPSLQSFKISMSSLPSINFVVEHPYLTDVALIGPPSNSWWRKTARSIQKLDWLNSKLPNLQRLHLMQVKLSTSLTINAPRLVSLSMTGVTSHKDMKLRLKARRLCHLFIQDPGHAFQWIEADLPSLILLRISRDVNKHRDSFTRTVKDKNRLNVVVHGDNRKDSYAALLRPFYPGAGMGVDGGGDRGEGGPNDPIDVDGDAEEKKKYQEVEARVAAANLPAEVKDYFGNNNMANINIALPLIGRLFAQHNMLFNPIVDLALLGRVFNGRIDENDEDEEEGEPYYCHNCHRMHYRRRLDPWGRGGDDDNDDDDMDDSEDIDEDEDVFGDNLGDPQPRFMYVDHPPWDHYPEDSDEDEEDMGDDADLARLYGAYLGARNYDSDDSDDDDDEE